MNKIQLLPPHEAIKIAAGEVVERPASVVKELLENSLDAGATAITLYLEKAGKQLIRIVDNGCGMSPDDARICFLPHATSKIRSLEDLDTIQSFGFRGEALATISAVSRVTLATRLNPELVQELIDEHGLGTEVEFRDGQCQSERAVGCPVGTDLAIADLFYNTPVRKKFLKSDETEWNQIQSFVYAVALSHLSVHFKLYRDGKMVLNAPITQTVADRVCQLWDYNLATNLIPLPAPMADDVGFVSDPGEVTITGAISSPQLWRYNRAQMFFFVNHRWVKNIELSRAALKGYANVLPDGKFPATFIFLTVDPIRVDVNIHPRKEEVRFLKPGMIEQAISAVVKKTLEQRVTSSIAAAQPQRVPDYAHNSFPDAAEAWSDKQTVPSFIKSSEDVFRHVLPVFAQGFGGHGQSSSGSEAEREEKFDISHVGQPFIEKAHTPVAAQSPLPATPADELPRGFADAEPLTQSSTIVQEENLIGSHIIGQLLNTYILVESSDGLVVVDQHAAHERVLYEKYLKRFESHEGVRLMFPQMVNLNGHQLLLVLEQRDFLLQQGIELEQFGADQVVVYTTPPHVQNCNVKELIAEMAAFLEEHEQLDRALFRKKLNEHLHGQLACKGAIKAGDKLTHQQMKQLLADLESVENRFICVHGRPTLWKIPQRQLEKQFQRIM